MKKVKVFNLAIIVAIVIAVVGCSNENNPLSSSSQKLSTKEFYTPAEVYAMHSPPNLTGTIHLSEEYENGMTNLDVEPTPVDRTNIDAQAGFFDVNTKENYSVGDFLVNRVQLKEFSKGGYCKIGYDDLLKLNFGTGTNDIVIQPTTAMPSVNYSANFSSPLRISNVVRGQVFSKSQPININWNAQGDGIVQISITGEMYNNLSSRTLLLFKNNTGSVSLPVSQISHLNNGWASLTITRIEPRTIQLSNGKNLLVLGKSAHRISIKISN